MKTFETVLTSASRIIVRVRAESALEARMMLNDCIEKDPDYFEEELKNAENAEWQWGPFDQVYHTTEIEYPTITPNGDGYDVGYEPVTEVK